MREEPMWSSSCSKNPESRWRRRARLALLGLLLVSSLGHAATWRDELPRAQRLGDGELRWLGFRIYHATLWAQQRPFQPELAFALQLRYHQTISRQRLVQTSIDEIRRLSGTRIDAATLARWDGTLNSAFTDVSPGDELIGVYAPGHGMRLYNQRHLLADIDDVALARAFFGIWLDQQSRDVDLRRQLMGVGP